MKRYIAMLLCALLTLADVSALANGWGLKGELYQAVAATHTWDEYTLTGNQAGNVAVLHTQYHNVLMLLVEGKLQAYTKAVYQPEDKKQAPQITQTQYGFSLAYGEDERYDFELLGGDGYRLQSARIGGFTLSSYGDSHYVAADETGKIIYYRSHRLWDFNIALLPHSVAEARQMNLMHGALSSGADCLGWYDDRIQEQRYLESVGTGTAAVYSAPFGASAWRAAKGKAAVGLNGGMWLLGRSCVNQDGEAYACVCYNVSSRTQRIGYVRIADLNGAAETPAESGLDDMIRVDVQAARETYLTDDPETSQYRQFTVPQGTILTCIGLYGTDYAYVEAEVKDGQFVDGGSIVWGFVPLKDLELFDPGEIQSEVMQQMAGVWAFDAGGNMSWDYLILRPDGTYIGKNVNATEARADDAVGIWCVRKYNAFQNLYWNDPPYEFILKSDMGYVTVCGLVVRENEFDLTDNEGGGGYVRVEGDVYGYQMRPLSDTLFEIREDMGNG